MLGELRVKVLVEASVREEFQEVIIATPVTRVRLGLDIIESLLVDL